MINDISLPWSTADLLKDIKKPRRKSKKKKTREPWSDDYSDLQYIYKKYGTPTKKSKSKSKKK